MTQKQAEADRRQQASYSRCPIFQGFLSDKLFLKKPQTVGSLDGVGCASGGSGPWQQELCGKRCPGERVRDYQRLGSEDSHLPGG